MNNEINRLIYISISCLRPGRARTDVKEIARASSVKNRLMGVTGALILADRYFAQIIEGRESSVQCLMESIQSDTRHQDVKIIFHKIVPGRQFENWGLAYPGEVKSFARFLERLHSYPPQENDVRRLGAMMRVLADNTLGETPRRRPPSGAQSEMTA